MTIEATDPDLHEKCSFCLALGASKIGRATHKGEWSGSKACDGHLPQLLVEEHNDHMAHLEEEIQRVDSELASVRCNLPGVEY